MSCQSPKAVPGPQPIKAYFIRTAKMDKKFWAPEPNPGSTPDFIDKRNEASSTQVQVLKM